ncbi:hypothetical protein ACFQ2M_22505 [Kitasatospora saccharophila]|uniref:hypothetical protein n=1 Tax=Kitasatospora saccharophila TaxID=407973 RepID=UPI00363045F5
MTDSRPSSGLPSRLLAAPEMVAACAVRDFTAVFRLAKARGGFHASRIARACELTPSRVGEVIAGHREITNMTVIERIADGLRIPGHMVGLAPRAWEGQQATFRPALPLYQPATPSAGSVLPSLELDGILAIAASTRVTPTVLRSLQASIEDYWRRDDEHGGEALRPAVMGQLRYVLDVLRDTADPNYQRSLHGIAAELARLTGWTYFDARQYSTARGYFTEALRLARVIGDRPFIANVLSCLSLQATYEDKAHEAITLARAAQDSARLDGGTPRLMAMLSMRKPSATPARTTRRPLTRRSRTPAGTSTVSTRPMTIRRGSSTSTGRSSPSTLVSRWASSATRQQPNPSSRKPYAASRPPTCEAGPSTPSGWPAPNSSAVRSN